MRSFFANAIRMAKLEALCAMHIVIVRGQLGWVVKGRGPSHEGNGKW